jgi:hypothetical protein
MHCCDWTRGNKDSLPAFNRPISTLIMEALPVPKTDTVVNAVLPEVSGFSCQDTDCGFLSLDFGLKDTVLESYSSSTPYRIRLHKVTIFDYEDENDDEDDFSKNELLNLKHATRNAKFVFPHSPISPFVT